LGLGLERPALLVVSDGSADRDRIGILAGAAARGGAWGFYLREPALSGRALAACVAELQAAHALRIVVRDRVDVALAERAFGVELSEASLPARRVRNFTGDRLRLGCSVHDRAGVERGMREGADWLIYGHVFPTAAKRGEEPRGVAALRAAVAAAAPTPVLAIGGIDAERLPEILATGARGVAVIGAVARAADPEAAVRALVQALGSTG
jgi:thiamine-phosphate diphosphorylase